MWTGQIHRILDLGRRLFHSRRQGRSEVQGFILPLIFTKRLCDVFDDELNRIAKEVGSRKKAFRLVKADHKPVRFYLPLMPEDPEESVWSVIRKLADKIGEQLTTHLRDIAKEKPSNPASSSPPGISAGVLFPGK
jgi:type I restriction-modification system DNA methylase subunit